MSKEFVRPYITEPMYLLSMCLDDTEVSFFNPNENDESWRNLTLSDDEFMQAFRVICSPEFDDYLAFRNDAHFCDEQMDEWFDKINKGTIDALKFESALHNFGFYDTCYGEHKAKAENARHEIIRRVSNETWRNACKLYCAMYGADYDVIRTV